MHYNDGKWHGWNGGKRPVHRETVVEVLNRDGFKVQRKASHFIWGTNAAPAAFRVIREYRKPREWWIDPDYAEVFTEHHDGLIHVREVIE